MPHSHDHPCCQPDLQPDMPQPAPELQGGHEKSTLKIEQMDCPTEERLIRDRLARNEHVSALHFNLLERRLQVHHAPGQLESVIRDIGELGM